MYTSGLILLIMGMGMTFLFLYIMILCTNVSSKLAPSLTRFIPEPEVKKPAAKPAPASDDEAIVAAIAAAMVKANA